MDDGDQTGESLVPLLVQMVERMAAMDADVEITVRIRTSEGMVEFVGRSSRAVNRTTAVHKPECPGPDCLMCSGAACNLCGAGCWNNSAPFCEHASDERHRDPEFR